jgi:hypothetical protein
MRLGKACTGYTCHIVSPSMTNSLLFLLILVAACQHGRGAELNADGTPTVEDAADVEPPTAEVQVEEKKLWRPVGHNRGDHPKPGGSMESVAHLERYAFHSLNVLTIRDDFVEVNRLIMHDTDEGGISKETHALPLCGIVDGWYMSLNNLPFVKVSARHHGPMELRYAACEYTILDLPAGRSIIKELPDEAHHHYNGPCDMQVVFVKELPKASETKNMVWKTDAGAASAKIEL